MIIEVSANPAASYHIGRVKRKLATGVYAMEAVSCFCGSTMAQAVTEKDRYGFDHAMNLCKECGVIYANPRMTKEAYGQFYANEYRLVYGQGDDASDDFAECVEQGTTLKEALYAVYQLTPMVVFDIGCHSGGWLKPFKDAGAECYGVDYGDSGINYGQGLGLSIQIGSLSSLEALAEHAGKKADLIILNHVLEHVTDLEATLLRVRDLLSDKGVLFVGVPGLLRWDRDQLWQNAHVWQWTAETLTYVMECCGFSELHADQEINSLWSKADEFRDKADKPTENIRDIANYLFKTGTRYIPKIRTFNKFPVQERRANIKSALSRSLPEVTALINKEAGHHAVVIGGGPSVDSYIRTIRNLKIAGAKIVAIERMYGWCLKHDLKPDYVVTMDASSDVVDAFEFLSPGSTHLVAVQCQPAVFDLLKNERVYLYNTPQKGMPLADLWDANDYEQITVVNGGGSVTICGMSMAMLLGMRTIHLFGFDCHVSAGSYANGIAGVGEQYGNYQVRIGERTFLTNSPYVSFAQDFFRLKQMAQGTGQLDAIKVYGDSLVAAMSTEDLRG